MNNLFFFSISINVKIPVLKNMNLLQQGKGQLVELGCDFHYNKYLSMCITVYVIAHNHFYSR